MRSLRVAFCLVLVCSITVAQAYAAGGESASAAKKCKKGYKKNKKGKCVKKKFAPKYGTFKSADGNTQLRVVKKGGKPYVTLVRYPPLTMVCSFGQPIEASDGGGWSAATVKVKGKSFSGTSRHPGFDVALSGKFTSTKAMTGTYSWSVSIPGSGGYPDLNCKSNPQSFSARR